MRKNDFIRASAILAALCAGLAAGCATRKAETAMPSADPELLSAEAAYERGDLTQAIIECIDIARKDRLRPGLNELQAKILATLAEQRELAAKVRDKPTQDAMVADYDLGTTLPDTYRLRQHVLGLDGSFAGIPNEMQEALANPVSIHLVDVDLSGIITQIGAAENVNIVADGALGGENTITIHVDDVPLAEVLEYVGRNLNVTFSVGRNLIWVTSGNASAGGPPLLTRIYRLRRGITSEELEGMPDTIGIIEAVTRFVPEQEGADILYNKKTNAILAKNTRENLALIEDIIDALDVRPPQVLIEARFLSTSVQDLRELGIDWVLQGPITVSTVGRNIGGTRRQVAETQIDGGATMGWNSFANAANGLNGSFTGILTDPAFQATLHALETYGHARTLSMPRVTAINNTEAHIRIGEDFRYYEDYDLEDYDEVIYTGNGNRETVTRSRMVPSGSPTLEELGIELTATPSVGSDMASINLKLAPSIEEFVRWEYFMAPGDSGSSSVESLTNETSMLKLPVFRKNEIETEVVVRSGETVVMGGLMEGTRQKTVEGVPIISKIPWIGQLFRHDVWEESRQNLIVFVTATIVSDTGEELVPLAPPPVIDLPDKVELDGIPDPAAEETEAEAAEEQASEPAAAPEPAAEP